MNQLFKTFGVLCCLLLSKNLSAKIMTDETYEDLEFFHLVSEMPYFGECTLPNNNEQTDCFKNAFAAFLKTNLVYPIVDAPLTAQVKVYVKFAVTEEGKVIGKKLVKSSKIEAYDNEALKVLDKLPLFVPGKNKGTLVKVVYLVAIDFEP